MFRRHHHYQKRAMLQYALSTLKNKKYRRKHQKLFDKVLVKTRQANQTLGNLVEGSVQFKNKKDLQTVKSLLQKDVEKKELQVLATVEQEAKLTENEVVKATNNEERIHECLEKLAEFAKAAEETGFGKGILLPHESEIERLVSELDQCGIHAPSRWKGKLALYDNPLKMLSRYRTIWKTVQQKGIAEALREDGFAFSIRKVKQFFAYLSEKISAVFNAIQLSFIDFINWLQARLNGGRFESITQSTHLASVHNSVTQSVKRLQKRYPSVDVEDNLQEVEGMIKKARFKEPQDFYRQAALDGLKRIKEADWTDNNTGLNLPKITALMWRAAKDQTAYDRAFGKSQHPERDTDDRLNTFVEYLWRAQREYNLDDKDADNMQLAKSACFPGTFNKMVESLDKLHPDVKIIRSNTAANELAVEEARNFYHQYPDQKAIYEAHTAVEPSVKQLEILQTMKNHVKGRLKEKLGESLEPSAIEKILDNLEYVQLPDPDNKADATKKKSVEKISGLEEQIILTWGKEADPDDYPSIASKAKKVTILDDCLKYIDKNLSVMQKNSIKTITNYTGDLDNKSALKAHLEDTKNAWLKKIAEAYAVYQSKSTWNKNSPT